MKKMNLLSKIYIPCLVSLFVVTIACTGNDKVISSEDSDIELYESNVEKFKYNNHEYIRFMWGHGGGRTWSVVHNPDCKYCKEK